VHVGLGISALEPIWLDPAKMPREPPACPVAARLMALMVALAGGRRALWRSKTAPVAGTSRAAAEAA